MDSGWASVSVYSSRARTRTVRLERLSFEMAGMLGLWTVEVRSVPTSESHTHTAHRMAMIVSVLAAFACVEALM